MTVATAARNDFDYLDRAFATQDYTPTSASKTEGEQSGTDVSLWGEDGFGFDDFLDIINPLQHIPVISTLYREFTGDELSPGARVIGGGIFGGGIGLATSVVNSAIEMGTGKDIGDHVLAMFKDEAPEDSTAVTAATPAENLPQKAAADVAPPKQESAASPLIQAQAAAPVIPELVKASTPAAAQGLEWKQMPPNLQRGLEQLQQMQGKNLSEGQMAQILSSFGKAAPEAATTPKPEATAPVTPTKVSAPAAAEAYTAPRNVSDNFNYLDSAV
ncbi:hypothetical protein GUA87_04535 [Sneathiella sp. P13V-1]|uniref:hypothetical protein n=1 Tax=Sneathiella sp. P13V-1 TaxID=2697366 RepID=UPI00187B4AED|nr:hypothetical protein [Sneathiella sp. P13V-1]MBE7636100.1 hypothetical protein [Sneathiella sp. P13V-1]